MGFLIRDASRRTQVISRPFWATMVAVAMIVVGGLWWAAAEARHASVVNASSTPIGSRLRFSQSDAELTLSGIYTSPQQDALVARFTPSPEAHKALPYRGDDFAVFVSSKGLSSKKAPTTSVLFGKMGTDGDYFLILPNPSDDVYSFVLVNKSPATSSAKEMSKAADSTSSALKEDGSVSSALSQLNSTDGTLDSKDSKETPTTDYDMAGFRLTLDPAKKESEYQPEVINHRLIDDNREFRFDVVFDDVLKSTAVQRLTQRYNQQETVVRQWEREANDMRDRLRVNQADSTAQSRLREAEKGLSKAKSEQSEIVDELTRYEGLEYDPGMFQQFQTEAAVIDK